ncbi:hypothetical protein [Amycolatopsis plumensis]|uniref:Uncharacterized protein n=1 Tax=Amycolatopsis plumensis TaxID=236508 RepID=A0ABV5U5U5_9PSEU
MNYLATINHEMFDIAKLFPVMPPRMVPDKSMAAIQRQLINLKSEQLLMKRPTPFQEHISIYAIIVRA